MIVKVDLDDRLVYVLQERALNSSRSFSEVVNDALGYVVSSPRAESNLTTTIGVYVRAHYTDAEIADLLGLLPRRVAETRRELGLKPNKKRRR